MGFGGGFGYSSFGASWAEKAEKERAKDRENQRQREAERRRTEERDRERERERERDRERERAEKERDEREKYRINVAVETKPFQPPRQPSTYNDPYRRYEQTKPAGNYSRIEVLNQPEQAPVTYPSASDQSAIQQVAPQREPRPYTYAAKTDPQREREREREYNYTPRDKRPRMDVAVEDQASRRGSVGKSKRKKEEEKKSPAHAAPPLRDFAALTKEIKVWPEVTSSPVEAWLRTVPDLSRVIAKEVYEGSDWMLSKTRSTKEGCEGGMVMVRINGAFLGKGWVIRGERGWDESVPTPPPGVELGRRQEERRVWGTDVYTDDSDLGMVLVHAGWVRWSAEKRKDDDFVWVTVRVVPSLVRYTATERNGVKTRGWGNGHDGLSVVVENVQRITVCRPF